MKTIHPQDNAEFTNTTLSLTDIDIQDRTYAITTATELDRLAASIQRVGLINPPLVKYLDQSRYAVVCGFGRVAACRKLGYTVINVKLAPRTSVDMDYVRWAITDNLLQRSLNLIELSRCYTLLAAICRNAKLLSAASAELGLDPNPTRIGKILALGRLPEFIQNSILSNTVALPVALELSAWQEDQATALIAIYTELKMSLGKQREVLTLVREIAFREDIDVVAVLSAAPLQAVLADDDLDNNQKTRLIRRQLKQRRFPVLTAAQHKHDRWVKDLKIGKGVKLAASDFFEDPNYRITFSFKNAEELRGRWREVERIINDPALITIIGPA